jgi:hypothetical protein
MGETVATDVAVLLHTPPEVVSESVTEVPKQIVVVPLIGLTVATPEICTTCLYTAKPQGVVME